jgi:hypothetical protein
MLPAPALAQALPPGMTMHRIQAGEPDAAGWMLAASTEGNFSVKLPLKFNDFTIAESDPAAAALRIYTVGARSGEGVKFTASRITYRKGAQSAKHFFANLEQGRGLATKPERVTPLRLGGLHAVDLVIGNASSYSHQRAVLLRSDLLLMVVESPREHEELVRQFAPAFFDSLAVTTP